VGCQSPSLCEALRLNPLKGPDAGEGSEYRQHNILQKGPAHLMA